MTATPVNESSVTRTDVDLIAPEQPARPEGPGAASRMRFGPGSRYALISTVGYAASLAIFGVLVAVKGAEPISVYHTIISSTLLNGDAVAQTALRAIPIGLAALAVAVPARAGLINVGGEGQLIMGAVAATGIGVAIGAQVPGALSWAAMCIGGALAGALWAAVSGVLRTWLGASEAVTTLLLNFIANDVMLYLIYQAWKDPNGSGQPQSRPLAHVAQLPQLFDSQLNIGVLIALVVVAVTWFLLQRTGWGFQLRVVGGNTEAARRAGLRVNSLLLSSMAVGGALAGLGGALNLAGVETQLRPDITLTFGYVAFLASFLGRHQPVKVVGAALLFSAVALSGNGLQITDGLDGTIVDILLALIVAVPLVMAKYRRRAA